MASLAKPVWNFVRRRTLESLCRSVVESMPRRIEAVIKAKGDVTKY